MWERVGTTELSEKVSVELVPTRPPPMSVLGVSPRAAVAFE